MSIKENNLVTDFKLPQGMLGKFGIVKLWPDIKAAEDECIARIKAAANLLQLECIEILEDGRLLTNPKHVIKRSDLDFVIHLHYDTAKLYDAYSFVALWNPISFYHEWGYARCSRNLMSHDDFLSCSSVAADDHIKRLLRKSDTHLSSFLNLYHSLPDIQGEPTLGDKKLFYVGINWEVLGHKKSRHQDLLKRLDSTGKLRIYGPKIFQGVRVWKDYKSYVNEITFDGTSIIEEIRKAGIVLALSSQAHKDSELMSNRLFEAIAAGALVICDENKFAKKYFGDTLLYIDSRDPTEKIYEDVISHVNWVNENADKALSMICEAQTIFKNKFTLKKNLRDLYEALPKRKQKLRAMNFPPTSKSIAVSANFFLLNYSKETLRNHLTSIAEQDYENFTVRLIIDQDLNEQELTGLTNQLAAQPHKIEIVKVKYCQYKNDKNKILTKLGQIILEVLSTIEEADAVVFVAPNERLFSNHLSVLAGALARDEHVNCAASACIIKDKNNVIHGNHENIDFRHLDSNFPIGYARFIFRLSALPNDFAIALPYMVKKPLAVLVGENSIHQIIPATFILQRETDFPAMPFNEEQENSVIISYNPNVLSIHKGWDLSVKGLDINTYVHDIVHHLTSTNKSQLRKKAAWLYLQLLAVKKHGFIARLIVAKKKLSSYLFYCKGCKATKQINP